MSTAALAGRRVLVPRAQAQAAALSDRIRALGGLPVEAPVLSIEPGDDGSLRTALRDLVGGDYELLCLTSPNGVDAIKSALLAERLDARSLAAVRTVACVGPGTAARLWTALGIVADLIPPTATTEALGQAVPPGQGRALLPRADLANPVLPELLTAKGYRCTSVVAYRTGTPPTLDAEVLADLEAGRIDLLAFASPSTVRNFVALLDGRRWSGTVVSIGPVTTSSCDELGIEVAVEAESHDLDGLVAGLVAAAGPGHGPPRHTDASSDDRERSP